MSNSFEVTTTRQLQKLYGQVNPISLAKETAALTPEYKKWLQSSPFFSLATIGPEGLDCSPRGDAENQVLRILDDKTLIIPDRRGNNRLDSLQNIVEDPRVALLFLIPGVKECLRINGSASLTTDPDLTSLFEMRGTLPKLVIKIEIKAVYFQCARSIIRSELWSETKLSQKPNVPTAGQMTKGAKTDFDAKAYDQSLLARQKDSLY